MNNQLTAKPWTLIAIALSPAAAVLALLLLAGAGSIPA